MEPAQKEMRLIVDFGTFPVVKVVNGPTGVIFTLALPNGITMSNANGVPADVRVGHGLHLYTEVLINAEPTATSIQ